MVIFPLQWFQSIIGVYWMKNAEKKTHLYPRIREMWSLIAGMVLKGIVSYVYPVIVRKANDKCYFRTSLAVGVGVLMNFPTYSYWKPNIHPSSLSRWGSVISLGCTPDKSYGKLTTPEKLTKNPSGFSKAINNPGKICLLPWCTGMIWCRHIQLGVHPGKPE